GRHDKPRSPPHPGVSLVGVSAEQNLSVFHKPVQLLLCHTDVIESHVLRQLEVDVGVNVQLGDLSAYVEQPKPQALCVAVSASIGLPSPVPALVGHGAVAQGDMRFPSRECRGYGLDRYLDWVLLSLR